MKLVVRQDREVEIDANAVMKALVKELRIAYNIPEKSFLRDKTLWYFTGAYYKGSPLIDAVQSNLSARSTDIFNLIQAMEKVIAH